MGSSPTSGPSDPHDPQIVKQKTPSGGGPDKSGTAAAPANIPAGFKERADPLDSGPSDPHDPTGGG